MTQTTTIEPRAHARPAPASPGAGRCVSRAVDDDSAESWALVARVQAGDVEATADLFRRYHAFVLNLAAGRAGNRLVAEDIAADVFVRVLRSIHTFAPRGTGQPFGAVLNTITVNLVRDHFKRSHTRLSQPISGEVLADLTEREAPRNPDFAAGVEASALRRDLATAIEALTPRQRQAVRLRYFYDLSEAEAAAVMGTNVPQLKALAFRAIRRLRRQSNWEVHR